MKRLLMVLAPGGVRHHALSDRGSVTIGRSEDCDVTIDDASVSRRHARLDVAEATLTVEDLGSANATAFGIERARTRPPR